MRLTRLDHLQFCVRDLPTTIAFYRDLLGFQVTWSGRWSSGGDWVHLRNGPCYLSVYEGAPGAAEASFRHMGWEVDDLPAFQQRLGAAGLPGESSPEGEHLYLLDPDGNKIELVQYHATMPRAGEKEN